jgi:CubicO group peptidase (beta-lactamase class C family)
MIRIQPPPLSIDPPAVRVDPPALTVTPPPITVQPPAITVQPPPLRAGRITVVPPAITVTPAALVVQPPALTVDPPPLTIDPPPLTVTPPPIEIEAPRPELVATGSLPPALAAFDRAMREYMERHRIEAGVLAVARAGVIRLERGYGWLNTRRSEAVQPDTPMRVASVVKPVTRAAIQLLIAQGRLTPATLAFPLLGLTPLRSSRAKLDARLQDVTVQHLADHRGGWESDKAPLFDPMFQTALISARVGRWPADAVDIIRFMLGRRLDFDPGTRTVYSNFGHCVLGRVIEQVANKPYLDFVRDDLLGPGNNTSVRLARSLPRDRQPREPVYSSPGPPVPNVVDRSQPPGPLCDGGFHIEAMDSHGGLIFSAPDLVRFALRFKYDGRPNTGDAAPISHTGSLPGTTAVLRWHSGGIVFAAVFNKRHWKATAEGPMPEGDEIGGMLEAAADSIAGWP